RRPEQIFQLVAADMPSDFPALRTLDSRAPPPLTPASTLLVPTKLYAPPPHPNLVVRARLIERLDCGLRQERPLTLICAPAGFGKTTLASDWISRMHPTRSIAWISLDDRDNDPAQFLRYLIAALQQVEPTDDFHLIRSEAVQRIVQLLLER